MCEIEEDLIMLDYTVGFQLRDFWAFDDFDSFSVD
jgi:hypothetical protein